MSAVIARTARSCWKLIPRPAKPSAFRAYARPDRMATAPFASKPAMFEVKDASGAAAKPSTALLDSLPKDVTIEPRHADLFRRVQAAFEQTNLGPDKWYIVLLVCITAGPDQQVAAQLYKYLISLPEFQTSASRQALIRRMREALMKLVSILGVCKPLEAIFNIAPLEREEDKDYSATRATWQADEANKERGKQWFQKVYTTNASDTAPLFAAHKDLAWVSQNITYGLYLSDRQVLNDVETQLVVLPGIMAQNLPLETLWHIRGTRRIGVSMADTKVVWNVVKDVAAHFEVRLDKVPTVEEVEPQV